MRCTVRALLIPLLLVGCGDTTHDEEPPETIGIERITFDALFVVNGASDSVSVIDASTNEVAGTIELAHGRFPHHLNLSPDKAELLLAVPGADFSGGHANGHGGHGGVPGALLRLDATTGETLAVAQFEAPNHNGLFVGGEVWTSQMVVDGEVLVLDSATLELREVLAAGAYPAEVTLSSDGKYAFAANTFSYDVTVYDAVTRAIVKTIPVGQAPVGAWAGSNNVMYVDNERTKDLTAIDATTLEVVRTYPLGFTPAMAAMSPDGEVWVTDTDNGMVVFYAVDSDVKLGQVATAAGAHAIAFSTDGTAAYISNQEAGSVTVIDVASHAVTKTIPVGEKPNGMVFRPR